MGPGSTGEQWWPKREDWPEFPPHDYGEHPLADHPRMRGLRIETNQALALLILDGAVMLLNGGEAGVSVQVACSDVFYCACADAEPIPPVGFGADLDLPFWALYDAHRKDGTWGAVAWCCLRRGMRPQETVEQSMREAGAWTAELEALPERE